VAGRAAPSRLEGVSLAQLTAPRKQSLGPYFWTVTAVMAFWSIASAIWIWVTPLDYLLPASSLNVTDRGADIDFLFRFMSVFGNAILTFVTGYVIYFAIVFRRRRDEPANTVGPQIHDAPALEFWWTLLPTLLVIVLAVMSTRVWYLVQYGTGAPALSVEVIGHQFNYEFRYPGLTGSVYDEMHLPLGKSVRVLVTSADVLHSFWVPEFRLKADTVPGLVQNLNFTPQVAGSYVIECTEFCGLNHSEMQAKLVVDKPADFDAWLAAQKAKAAAAGAGAATVNLAAGNAAAGQALFAQKCSACHSAGSFDQKKVGPGLGKLFTDKAHPTLVDGASPTKQNVAHIIEKGYSGTLGAMPNAQQNGLSDTDVANVTAYLASLK
jgi:cytochrome c oxidase subunit 2